MANYTEHLNLYEVNPKTDGNMTFNIDSMLNDNWDKLDAYASKMDGMLSNENLLINWDFRNPVNTNGQTTYISSDKTQKITIDKWRMGGTNTVASWTVNVVEGGVMLDVGTAIANNLFNVSNLDGLTLTASLLVDDTYDSVTFTWDKTAAYTILATFDNGYRLAYNAGSLNYLQVYNYSGAATALVKAVKLELGAVSTLKNDTPADKAEQENLCARFGRDGNLITGPLYCNTNLLINADFRNPVNQRGQTSYTGAVYGLDMWKSSVSSTVLSIVGGGIKISSGGTAVQMLQFTPDNGMQVTLSAKINGEIISHTFIWDQSSTYIASGTFSNGFRLAVSGAVNYVQLYNVSGSADAVIESAKLELGSVSTLQNDPPQDYGVELLKCQRYQLILQSNQVRATTIRANDIGFMVPTPVQMRDTPSISINNLKVVSMDGKGQEGFTFSVSSRRSNGVYIVAAKTSHGLKDAFLLATNNDTNADTLLDANL